MTRPDGGKPFIPDYADNKHAAPFDEPFVSVRSEPKMAKLYAARPR
jgi:hypothetical protein